MTCIVGLVDQETGDVYIGGDSAGIGGDYRLTIRADSKVFRVGPFLMGFSTSFRMGQLLRYSLKVDKQKIHQTDSAYMMTTFIGAVRKTLTKGGFAKITDNREEGGSFMVAYRGKLYVVYGDYQVAEPQLPYIALGCGGDCALGSLYSTEDWESTRQRIREALNASITFSAGVHKPFIIRKLR